MQYFVYFLNIDIFVDKYLTLQLNGKCNNYTMSVIWF